MRKILLCFGTRPEAIKMATLIHEFKREAAFECKVCVTAQHREMLDQVLDFFEIAPDYDLNIMKANQSLNELSSRIIMDFDKVLVDYNPDVVLVHGDTSTSSICALAAFHRGIKVGHVEAGLRTFDKFSPFPEEMNRVITSRIADFHFAPTMSSSKNLLEEKIPSKDIVVTGNTVIDSLFWTVDKFDKGYTNDTIKEVENQLGADKKVVLITAHRRENFGKGFISICNAIKELASANKEVMFLFPVHLNPNVQQPVFEILHNIENIILTAPLDYPTFVWAMKRAFIILTDSGGVQEEAPSLGKPVLVMRDSTERPEAVDAGTVLLVGTDREKIIKEVTLLLADKRYYEKMANSHNPYGDGNANSKIIKFLLEHANK